MSGRSCPSRIALWFATGLALLFGPLSVAAQTYPDRPVRLVAPVPPGGSGDLVSRLVGNAAAESLGRPVVIENRPGATGNIGTVVAVKAPADGYTILLCSIGNCAVNASLYSAQGLPGSLP